MLPEVNENGGTQELGIRDEAGPKKQQPCRTQSQILTWQNISPGTVAWVQRTEGIL